ncbi:MAG: ABC transporter permease [Saprospiraceae bacterium]|nr:ABC transporter permease [Saprospiraceae bacterium]
MLQNYLRLAFRHLRKNKTFSAINLVGLALGLAAAMAVLLYVQDEISYEKFHLNAARIARVESSIHYDGQTQKLATAPNILAPFLQERLPEVEAATRVFANNFTGVANVKADNKNHAESQFYWADSNVFGVFTFKMLEGSSEHALEQPNTAIVSASTARRYFGDSNPVGKTIRVDNYIDLEISGVFADFPANTHSPFDIVAAFHSVNFGKTEHQSWGNASFYTYLLLRPATDFSVLEKKIEALVLKDAPAERLPFQYSLKPLLDVHLHSADLSTFDKQPYGDIRQVHILVGLAVLLLFIACINYMNLATAQSQRRAREVSLSKTLGARSGHLAARFYTETALITLIGIGGSIFLLRLGLPFFNELADKNLSATFLTQAWFWAGIVAIWFLVTLVAGAYPAVFLSSFSPSQVSRLSLGTGAGSAGWFRKGLVVLQFCISTALIVSTLVFYKQLEFIRDKKLGYAPTQVVALNVYSAESRQQKDALEHEIGALASVKGTAYTQTFPGRSGSGRTLSHLNETEGPNLTTCRARPDIFAVLDIPLIAGRPMRVPQQGDTITEIVINRTAAAQLGWTPEQCLGRKVEASLPNAVIVGVTEDFHHGSMREKIGNYAFHNARTEGLDFLLVKLQNEQLTTVMRDMEAAFRRTMPNSAFDFVFLDEHLDALYRGEQRMAKVALVFALLAVLIACLGLFALAAFAAERRTKEIGIRKVLGASVAGITGLLAKDFLKLVVVAIVIGSPLAYWVMNKWLSDFAYRIEMEWWMFALAGVAALLVALFTVSYQGVRAALVNPAQSLKSE